MNAHDPTTAQASPVSPARERLRSAIAERTAAEAALAAASQSAIRAQNIMEAAQRRVEALGDVDGEIAAHHAAAYRAYAETGGERPELEVPAHLADRQRRLTTEREQLAAARAAHAALAAENDAAREALALAKDNVLFAAKAVLEAEADRLAAKLEAVVSKAHALRDDLLALAGLSVMERGQTWAEGRLHLSPEALRRATTPLDWRPQLPGTANYEGRRLPAWQRMIDALQNDPNALSNDLADA
jgi:hypothetical protein